MQLGQDNIVPEDFSGAAQEDASMGIPIDTAVDYVYTEQTPSVDMGVGADQTITADVIDVASQDDAEAGVYMRAASGAEISPIEAAAAGIDIAKLFKTATGAVLQFQQAKNAAGQTVYVSRPVAQQQQALPKWALPAAIVGALLLLS